MKKPILLLIGLLLLGACAKKKEPINISANDFHKSVDRVGQIMVHDIFSPPVASRVFSYPSIAAYEIIAQGNEKYNSLEGQLTNLTAVPSPPENKEINFNVLKKCLQFL